MSRKKQRKSTQVLSFRVSTDEKELIQLLANDSCLNISNYIRKQLLPRA